MHRAGVLPLLLALAACATQAPDIQPPSQDPVVSGPVDASGEPVVSDPVRMDPEARPPEAAGLGDLMIAPTRVVLEGNRRVAEVLLVNVGDVRGTYRISLVDYEMDEKGGMTELPEGTAAGSASGIVRFSPRQVTLDPNYSQTIRIQVRKPADLAAGEYRSHLLFRSVPSPEALDSPQPTEEEPTGLSIRLRPVFGISIPLIVRHGDVGARAELADVTLGTGAQTVVLRINRQGTRSVYGSFVVRHHPSGGGEARVVGTLDGVAVYPPLNSREVTIPLSESLEGHPGTLTVTYSDLETPSRGVIDEASIRID